jgi:hypothetical protein
MLNRHLPAISEPQDLSPVRLIERVGEVKPWKYPSLNNSHQVAIVRYVNGLWIADNWLAQHYQSACGKPYLSDSSREHLKAAGVRFESRVERGPQP